LCGKYELTSEATVALVEGMFSEKIQKAALSHSIRSAGIATREPRRFTVEILKKVQSGLALPSADEQLDLLIRWLGDSTRAPGEYYPVAPQFDYSVAGCIDCRTFEWIVEGLVEEGTVERRDSKKPFNDTNEPLRLTHAGWRRYNLLKQGDSSGKRAFMAMQFGDSDLDSLVENHMRAAVKQTGFRLFKLDDDPQAGLINNRMLVEIRRSRFVIADLSHRNPGAYWEAGFAEGLDKPVIYTCERSVFDDKQQGTHFDVNHHQTVIWDATKPDEFCEQLKATIRATLPAEAKMSDEEE
jgi:nucleoside 2-deoxyribosyltransferase